MKKPSLAFPGLVFKGKKKKGKKEFFGTPYKKPKKSPKAKPAKIGGQSVWQKEKAAKSVSKKAAKYKYSIVQSKDQRVATYNTREQAIIALNKRRETMPSHKYRIIAEKQPPGLW